MDKKLISIIIPCLNSAKTIDYSLQSVLNQSIRDSLEIIVVDGGSTDQTLEILDKYVEKEKIIVLKAKEKGVPGQIALGIKRATGAYVGFIDSDDYIDRKMYEILLKNLVDTDSDISACQTKSSSFGQEKIINNYNQNLKINTEEPYLVLYTARFNKLIKYSLLLKVIKSYNESINNISWEDTIFAYVLFSLSNKTVMTDLVLYYHCLRANSLSRQISYDITEINKLNLLCKAYDKEYSRYKNDLYYRLYTIPIKSLYIICFHARFKKCCYKRRRLYEEIQNSFAFKSILKRLSERNIYEYFFGGDKEIKIYKKFLRYLKNGNFFKLDHFLLINLIFKLANRFIRK